MNKTTTLVLAAIAGFGLSAQARTTTTNLWNVDFTGVQTSQETGIVKLADLDASAMETAFTDGSWDVQADDDSYVTNAVGTAGLKRLELDTQGNDLTWTPSDTGPTGNVSIVEMDVRFVAADDAPDGFEADSVQTAFYLWNDYRDEHGDTQDEPQSLQLFAWTYDTAGETNHWEAIGDPFASTFAESNLHVQILIDYTDNTIPYLHVSVNDTEVTGEGVVAANFDTSKTAGKMRSVTFKGTGTVDNFTGRRINKYYDTCDFTAQIYLDGVPNSTIMGASELVDADRGAADTEYPDFKASFANIPIDNAVFPSKAPTYALSSIVIVDLSTGNETAYDYTYDKTEFDIVPVTTACPDATPVGRKLTLTPSTYGATNDSVIAKLYYQTLDAYYARAVVNVGEDSVTYQQFVKPSSTVTTNSWTFPNTTNGTYVLRSVVVANGATFDSETGVVSYEVPAAGIGSNKTYATVTYVEGGYDAEALEWVYDAGTGTYTLQRKTFTVTWMNGEDTLAETNGVAYGDVPEYYGAEPTKASTAQYDYAFAGWTPAVIAATSNATYNASFTETVRSYDITWVADGNADQVTSVAYGQTPVAPEVIAPEGKVLDGWTPAIVAVTGATTYTAVFVDAAPDVATVISIAGGTTHNYKSLAEAFAAAGDGDTVKLLANADLTERLFVNAGATPAYAGSNNRYATTSDNASITLDLNGHCITNSSNIALAGGSLNITGAGTIATTSAGLAPIEIRGTGDLASKRTLTIGEDVVLSGAEYGLNVFGSNDAQKNVIDVTIDGTVNGMLFVLGNLTNPANEIDIEVNGTVSAPHHTLADPYVGIALNGNADVTVNDGAYVSGDTGIEVRAGSLTVNGGTIVGASDGYSFRSNGSGTSSYGVGIAVVQHTTKKDIDVTVTDGEITGNIAFATANPENNNVGGLDVSIEGGEFTGTGTGAIAVDSDDERINGFVSGGKFSSVVDDEYAAEGFIPVTEPNGEGKYEVERGYAVTFTWHGGSSSTNVAVGGTAVFPADPASYVENGTIYTFSAWSPAATVPVVDAEQTYAAQYTTTSAKATVISIVDGTQTYYATLQEAISAAAAGDTVQLLDDAAATRVTVEKNLVIDLGGHTYTGRLSMFDGNVVVTNGTVAGRFDVYDSSVVTLAANTTVDGYVIVWGDGVYGEAGCKTPTFNLYGTVRNNDPETTDEYAISTSSGDDSRPVVNIYEGAVVETIWAGVGIRNGASLNMTGGSITAGEYGIYNNGSDTTPTTINVSGGTVTSTNEVDTACGIYQAGPGALTLSGTAVVSGPDAVEVRAGTVQVLDNARLVATMPYTEPASNGNGNSGHGGVALLVSQHTTAQNVSASVDGGTLQGAVAFQEATVETQNDETKVSGAINAGAILGEVLSEDIADVIPSTSSALFADADAEGVEEGYGLQEDPENPGLYKVVKTYVVTYANYDGAALQVTTNFVGDATPAYAGATPVKPADASGVYEFDAWSPAVAATVTADATYTATFTTTSAKATVITITDAGATTNTVGYYATLAEAVAAATNGTTVVLLANVNEAINNTADKNFTIDLNGQTWSSDSDVLATSAGTITINATNGGTMTTEAAQCCAVWAKGGDVVINGGTFNSKDYEEATIYVSDAGSVVTINGGTFENKDERPYRWKSSLQALTLNVKNDLVGQHLVINGGTFIGNDPQLGDDTAGGTSAQSDVAFVSDGYVAIVDGEGNFVVQEGYNVTFDANGGSPTPDAQRVAKGGKATAPTAPTKASVGETNYTFRAWQLAGSDYDFDTVLSADITLVAAWTEESQEEGHIGAKSDDGFVILAPADDDYDTTKPLTFAAPDLTAGTVDISASMIWPDGVTSTTLTLIYKKSLLGPEYTEQVTVAKKGEDSATVTMPDFSGEDTIFFIGFRNEAGVVDKTSEP